MSKQHTQLPNKMLDSKELTTKDLLIYVTIKRHINNKTKEAFPSLDTICKESGVSKPTVIKCIESLKAANYISVRKEGRKNVYKFNPYVKFEPFSEEFLDSKEIDPNTKAYIIGIQEHLFKDLVGEGKTTYSDKEIADKLNLDSRTVVKYNNILQEKGFLTKIETNKLDKVSGIKIEQKFFHLSKLGQQIIWTLQNHEERLDEHSKDLEIAFNKINDLEKKAEIAENQNRIMRDILRANDIEVDNLEKYVDKIIL